MSTFYVPQEGPVNALALNRDNTQVAIGGRNVFKVYTIEEDSFKEVCNLRASKHLNLSFSCNDVSWSPIDDHYLATAATNGHVCVWNLTKMGKAMQEQDYQEHKRTVNKVNFHASEPYRLISGSQDGTMRYFDIRLKSAVAIFYSTTESVRDVQFSVFNTYTFAAVSENGAVQLWDLRRSDKCQQQFTAHSGPIFACDWHPDKSTWLATASRDKTIKVWNLSARPTLEHTIHTIASVGHIKWRPQREFHIASCALVVDCSINIWDVRRPYIPFAAFNEHKDIASGVAWRGDPHIFLSSGRDCALYHHSFNAASRPANSANPQGISVNIQGEILFAYKAGIGAGNAPPTVQTPTTGSSNSLTSATTRFATTTIGITRKISNVALTSVSSANSSHHHHHHHPHHNQPSTNHSHFHIATSLMRQLAAPERNLAVHIVGLANNYVLSGKSLSEICEHNSTIAMEFGCEQIAMFWRIIRVIFGEEFIQNSKSTKNDNNGSESEDGSGSISTNSNDNTLITGSIDNSTLDEENVDNNTNTEDGTNVGTEKKPKSRTKGQTLITNFNTDDDTETEDQVDHVAIYSNGFPTYLNYRTGHPKGDFCFGDTELDVELEGPIREYRNGYRGMSNLTPQPDWTLPNEGFPIRHEIRDRSPPPEQFPKNATSDLGDDLQGGLVMDDPAATITLIPSLALPKYPLWDASHIVSEALKYHATLGDVQTAVCVLIVLGEQRRTLVELDENLQEHWLLSYIDLLHRFQVWNVATRVIKLSWLANVNQLNQQSTRFNTNCGQCCKILHRTGWVCDRCHTSDYATCGVCHEVVKGLYAWCQGCSHGGHLAHIRKWMQTNKTCPMGCGHLCEYR